MRGYTKEFLVDAFLYKFREARVTNLAYLETMVDKLYDEVGKDKFRVYCALDAKKLKEYKECLK